MKPKEGVQSSLLQEESLKKTVEEAERTNNIAEAFENVLEHGEKVLLLLSHAFLFLSRQALMTQVDRAFYVFYTDVMMRLQVR